MKDRTAARGQVSAAERRARLRKQVKQARAKGEKVPPGVKLINFRELKPSEIVHGKGVEKVARACLSRKKVVA